MSINTTKIYKRIIYLNAQNLSLLVNLKSVTSTYGNAYCKSASMKCLLWVGFCSHAGGFGPSSLYILHLLCERMKNRRRVEGQDKRKYIGMEKRCPQEDGKEALVTSNKYIVPIDVYKECMGFAGWIFGLFLLIKINKKIHFLFYHIILISNMCKSIFTEINVKMFT